MRKLKRVVAVFGLIVMTVFLLNSSNNAYAVDADALTKKVLLRGLEKCYENEYIPSGTTIDGSTDAVTVDKIMSDKGKKVEEDTIKIFSKEIGNKLTQEVPALSCMQVFEGWGGPGGGSSNGLKQLTGKSFDISKVGFHSTESVSENWGCLRFPFSYIYNSQTFASNSNYSNGICFMLDGDGKIMEDENDVSIYNPDLLLGEYKGKLEVNVWFDPAGNIGIDSNNAVSGLGYSSAISINCQGSAFLSRPVFFEDVSKCVVDDFGGETKTLHTGLNNSNGDSVDATIDQAEISYSDNLATGGLGKKWTKDASDAAIRALEYYAGTSSFVDITFSDAEKYAILQEYVKKVMDSDDNMGLDLDSCYDSISELGSDYGVLNAGKWCKITGWESHKDEKFNVIKNEIKTDKQALKTVTFEDVLKRIKKIDESQIDSNVGLGVGVEDEEGVCYANSGALGWIICPIIEGVSRVGTAMWEFIESNFLQIRAVDLFKDGGGMELVWQRFRDFANILFIILFLVVIFSQLTGVGIDNYGIKKIMPKLVIVAIMVNLSFLICALAVDVSNILGSALNSLFSSMAGDMPSSVTSLAPADASTGSILAVVGIGLGGAALFGILNPVGALTLGGAVLGVGLAVLGIVISIVFAILFMFIILIIRNAGVVMLIAVSPVAIICYMLPNTEKIFKKWFDLLKALLVVYPICGAMIGAGRLAGNLLASIPDSAGMAVAGMIVNVLPFFLVPMLLKRSLSLMGNVGARLSSVGKSMGKRTSSFARDKITGTEGVKDWSQAQRTQANVRRAQRIQNRLEDRLANGRTLSRRQQSKLRSAQDVVLAQRKAEQENEVRTHAGYAEAMRYKQDRSVDAETRAIERLNNPTTRAAEAQSAANEERQQQSKARTALMMHNTRAEGLDQLMIRWNAAFDSGNTDDLDAVTNVINQRYGSSGASMIGSALSGKHNIANNQNYQASMRALQQTMSDNSSFAGNMKTKSPDAFQMIGDAGMRYDRGTGRMVQEDMSYFTNHNETATKASDWAVTSGATLQRGLNAVDEQGHYRMSNEMINTLLTSQDPAIMSGIQSEDGKREMLEAALYNRQHNPSGVGPNLDNRTASQNYRQDEADRQSFEELTKSDEQDAERRGKVNINIPGSIVGNTTPTTIQGYAVPRNPTNGSWSQVGGDHVYTFRDGNGRERQWNANTGRYIRPQPPNNP